MIEFYIKAGHGQFNVNILMYCRTFFLFCQEITSKKCQKMCKFVIGDAASVVERVKLWKQTCMSVDNFCKDRENNEK